jgi:general secretion pathway protein C
LIVIRERIAALNQRERLLLLIAAGGLLILLVYLLVRDGAEEAGVELTTPMPTASVAAPAPPLPVVPMATAPAAPVAPPADTNALSTVVLRGISGGGPSGRAAIFALPNGAQRVVRVGREVIPGVMLQGVGMDYAIVSAGGGGMRLSLGKAGGVPVAAPAPAASAVTSAPAAISPSGAESPMSYRTALAPRRSGSRITGFTIREGANVPLLARAGLQPGDVLVAVNGQAFESEEKVLELGREIAGSYTAEFEFERGGQRMRRSIEINKRPQ